MRLTDTFGPDYSAIFLTRHINISKTPTKLREQGSAMHTRWVILCFVFSAILSAEPAVGEEPAGVIEAASNPRIAMLWSPAEKFGKKLENWAKYGVLVLGVDDIGLEWTPNKNKDMSETIAAETISAGRKFLADLKRRNPRAIVCLELYFFEADDGTYPDDSPWWYRDKSGKKVQFWKGCHNMDVGNAEYIAHIAKRVAAVEQAVDGQAGIFLDNLRFDAKAKVGWTALLDSMRKLGDFPILINSGWDSDDLEWIAPKINGIMYEDSVAHTSDKNPEKFYARIQADWERLRQPRIGINEKFGKRDDEASMRRELVRTLVYTDLYYLYADSTNGHNHRWRSEWDPQLGLPKDKAVTPAPGTLARRDFDNGTVVWLPADAKQPATINLATPHRALGEKEAQSEITLQPGSGAILIREK